jgi:hypothetical protein
MPCPRAPTSRDPFVCRCPMPCTPEQPHLLVAAHNPNMVKDRRQVMDAGDIDSASSVQRATYERISHDRDRGCASHAHQPSSVHFASSIASMLPLPCLACHAAPHFATPCYAGAVPSCCALYRLPRDLSARPARPAASPAICVCSMCCSCAGGVSPRLRSGRQSVASRLLLLSVAVALFTTHPITPHHVLQTAHTSRKPHTPLAPPRHSHLTRRAPHTHCTYHTLI